MDDMERYGDYNEVDEAPTVSPVLKFIKVVAVIICIAVVGVIAFRMFTFNYYPSDMKSLYFTDSFADYYRASDGDIKVETQKLRAPYDDSTDGNFFCDHLRVCRDGGYLQITLRFNVSLARALEENYGVTVDLSDTSKFTFRLYRSGDGGEIGSLANVEWDEFIMYRYAKLTFENIDFGEGSSAVSWIRLEIFVDGVDADKDKAGIQPFMIPVYENNSEYSKFTEYNLSRGEIPE
ncbi:MAG: hypothetical protein IJY69_04285 [Clostridia bacterium]|nr:hypothetical protein [Clostridia bacterium]